jgi:PAS domain S-box-containing protein
VSSPSLETGEKVLRVLLVEHDAADAELCIGTLRAAGYTVQADVVASPEDFLLRLREKHYDLILSVFNIPGWSGLDALKLLSQEKKNIPFMLVTGTLGDEMAVSCVQQGVTDYILKERLTSRLPEAVERAMAARVAKENIARAEEELRQSEARFRDLVENSVCGIYQVTVPGEFLHVNPALCRMLGYETKQEMMELSAASVYRNSADRDILLEEYQQSGHVRGAEVEWKRKDGSPIIVRLSAHGVHDNANGLKCIEVIAEDIT